MIAPADVKAMSEGKLNSNYEFWSFLVYNANEEELDKKFLDLHNELFVGYDCSSCRNCCKEYATALTKDEVDRICALIEMPKDAFVAEYAYENDGDYMLKDAPCRFLGADNACQLESCKPQSCKDYPNTNKPGRLSHLPGIFDSSSVCPVVFEIVERLKAQHGIW